MNDADPTNALRHRCNLATSLIFSLCNTASETDLYCLRDCPNAASVWREIGLADCSIFHSTISVQACVENLCACPAPYLFLAGILLGLALEK